MATYSINTGTSTETMTYNIIGATAIDLSPVLDILKDNSNKEINPKDIRDAVLTSFSNSAFKQTLASQSTISYIGVDTVNPNYLNKDVKKKVYFGKRAFSQLNSYSYTDDIMTSSLLNSDTDIFLYNTKKDTVSNNRTKIAILAGTNSSLYTNSPYLQSQIITVGTYSSLSLDIINPTITGATYAVINFNSDSGTVSFNNIAFPSLQSSYGLISGLTAAGNDRVLKWNNGILGWDDILLPDTSYIGVTGSAILNNGLSVTAVGASVLGDSYTSRGVDVGAKLTAGPATLVGYYYDGKGLDGQNVVQGLFNANGVKSDDDGGYVQGTVVVPGIGTKLGASWGRSNSKHTASTFDFENESWVVGAYHPLTKHLNLVAEYVDQEVKNKAATTTATAKTEKDTISLGAILFF
jgi:hypothetical protein